MIQMNQAHGNNSTSLHKNTFTVLRSLNNLLICNRWSLLPSLWHPCCKPLCTTIIKSIVPFFFNGVKKSNVS